MQAVRALLPQELNAVLGNKLPTNVSHGIVEALAAGQPRERTVQQLVEYRVLPRWDRYWAEQLLPAWKTETDAGRTPRPPYGPLLRMLEDTPECSSISCDDRTDVHTREPCPACAMRAEDKRAGWGAARGHAASVDDVRDRRDSTPPCPHSVPEWLSTTRQVGNRSATGRTVSAGGRRLRGLTCARTARTLWGHRSSAEACTPVAEACCARNR